jgi:4-amino-4-deoxy-L-arabinose transferase-like glycosyltransferase
VRCAIPGVFLSILCLLPFVNKAYTIDDAYFLFEAQQTLRTPRTPAATAICWDNVGYKRPLRQIGSPALLMGYFLAPVALFGSEEWMGHLLTLFFLLAAVAGTVALTLRCRPDPRQATLAGLIFASTPAVLGMAGTVFPDVPCAALVVWGMERLLAWKEQRKLHQALAAALLLGLAPIGRSHLLLMLPIGAFLMLCEPLRCFSFRNIRIAKLVLTVTATCPGAGPRCR